MGSWDRWAPVPSMAFLHGSWRGVYIKIAHDKGRERQKWGVLARMGTAHVGEIEAHVYKRNLSGYHGYRRDLFVMSWDSSCGQLDLTTSQHVVTDALTSACGQSMGQGFSLLYAVSIVWLAVCSQSDGAQISNCFNFCAWGFYRSVRRPMLCNVSKCHYFLMW